jgi:hypothetical protein
MKKLFVFITASLFLGNVLAFGAECTFSVKRYACPGKDKEAFKPYGGKQETQETKKVGSLDACKAAAESNCPIVRKGTLLKKEVKAKFNGTDIDGGKNLCTLPPDKC